MFVRALSSEDIFSSFLANSFGLLLSSFYGLTVLTCNRDVERPLILEAATLIWIFIIIIAYVIYPDIPQQDVNNAFSNHLGSIVLICISITLIFSLLHSSPTIERIIHEYSFKSKQQESEAIKAGVDKIALELKKEGRL